MFVYLVRHGEKVKQIGDPPLTKKGRLQAQETGKFFRNKDIFKIYSSPYLRARETSEIINSTLKVGVFVKAKLKERMNWGNVSNQTMEEFLKEWYHSSRNRKYIPKGEISSYQSGKNLQKELARIVDKSNKGKNILVVCHGGIIADYLRNLLSEKELVKLPTKYLEDLIKEGSITTLELKDSNLQLKEFASTKHLSEKDS